MPFVARVNQWAGRLGMGQIGIAEQTISSSKQPWLIAEVDVALCFLQEEDKREVRVRVEEYLSIARVELYTLMYREIQ